MSDDKEPTEPTIDDKALAVGLEVTGRYIRRVCLGCSRKLPKGRTVCDTCKGRIGSFIAALPDMLKRL